MVTSHVVRPTILGGVDGVITSFAIVAAGNAASLDDDIILVVGLSSVVADGLSMGISEYLSNAGSNGDARPIRQGIACLASFIVFGMIPPLVYVFSVRKLFATCMFALVELMILGAGRSILLNEGELLSGLVQTILLGGVAGGIAYVVAQYVHDVTT